MISRIRGILIEKNAPAVMVEVGGIGYEVFVPMTTLYQLSEIGQEVILYTHFVVREDAQLLFGFISKADRTVFQELIKVNGIGAKMALAILSGMDRATLLHSFEQQDYQLLCSIPGIGRKTAERLVVEMKDKFNKLIATLEHTQGDSKEHTVITRAPINAHEQNIADAINALEALNFKPKDAEKFVLLVKDQADDVESLIRLALQRSLKK